MTAAPEQEMIDDLRGAVRSALGGSEPGTADPDRWRLLAEQIGVGGALVAEQHGGLGLGARELVAVAEEVGAAAAAVPFLSHAVAAPALLGAAPASDPVATVLAEIAVGTRRFAVAGTVEATTSDDAVLVTGTVPVVADAPGADALLIEATGADGTLVCLVERGAGGLSVTERGALDLTRSIGSVTFDATPATVLLAGADARRGMDASARWSRLALAADQVGVARRVLEITVEYAGIRTQFGSVIGSFQAVKHRCTDVLLEVELAAALVAQAATALDLGEDPQDLGSTAALQAGTAALLATETAIALHGGIGFTWEHVAHHYFRRARANASLLGPTQQLRDAVAASAGI